MRSYVRWNPSPRVTLKTKTGLRVRKELTEDDHPIETLAKIRAVDNVGRIESLNKIRNSVKSLEAKLSTLGIMILWR